MNVRSPWTPLAIALVGCVVLMARGTALAQSCPPLEERLGERWRWRVIPGPDDAQYTTWIRPWEADHLVAVHDAGLSVFDGYAWSSMPEALALHAGLKPTSLIRLRAGLLLTSRHQLHFLDAAGVRHTLFDQDLTADVVLPTVSPDGRALFADAGRILELSGTSLNVATAPPAPDGQIDALAYDTEGRLWCSTPSGVYRVDGSAWKRLYELPGDGVRINRIVPAGTRTYFLAFESLAESVVWDGNAIRPMGGEAAPLGAWDAVGLPDGELVVAGKSASLCVYRDAAWRPVAPNPLTEERNRSLAVLGERRVAVLTGSGRLLICDFQSDRWTAYDPTAAGVSGVINAIAPASAGGYWVGTDHGIARFDGEAFQDVHLRADETALNGVTTILEDEHLQLWVGSGSAFTGARRWDGSRWHVHDESEGIGNRRVHAVRRAPDGALWFALHGEPPRDDVTGGLARRRDGAWKTYGTADGLPSARGYDVAFGPDGAVYAAVYHGVARLVGDRWEPLPTIPDPRLHAFALVVAPDGALWLGRGLEDRGVYRFFDGKWTEMRGPDWNDAAAADFEIAPDGRLWFAAESGLAMTDGVHAEQVSQEFGSLSRNYWPVVCDETGTVWAGSRGGGLIRFRPDDHEPPRVDRIELVGPTKEDHVHIRWTARDRWKNTLAGRIRYRVSIDGEPFRMIDGKPEAMLSTLSAGPHRVEVTAIDLWGNAAPSPAQITFDVQPADGRTPLFFIVGLVAVCAGAIGIILYGRSLEWRRRRRVDRERRQLAASEEHFRTLVEGAEVILARFDAENRLTYISPQIQALSGVTPSELIARGGMPTEKIHPDDLWQVEQMRDARRAGDRDPREAEFRIRGADGNWIWILYCQRARASADGAIEGYDVVILETTVRKEQEASVRRERDFLYRLLEVAGSQLTDLGDFCAHVANTMADALETSMACVSLIEGETLRVIALWDHGEIRRNLRFPIAATPCAGIQRERAPCALRGRLAEQFPDDPCIRQGNVRCFAGVPIASPSGKLIGVVAVLSEEDRAISPAEVTRLRLFGQFAGAFIERHQAEVELKESERTLQTLMSNLPGMAYRCRNDANWTMEFVSEGCRELCGYDTSDLLFNRTVAFNDLIHPDDQDQVWADVQAALRERRAFELQYRIRTASGAERWVWEQGRGVYTTSGELVSLEGFITDISELRRAEAVEAGQRAVLEQIAKGAALPAILESLVRNVEALSSGMIGSVLLLDDEGKHLRHASAPNLPESYNRAIDGTPIGPVCGSCGTAAHRKARVIVSDILTDPLWADFRDLAATHGLRACWSEPIRSGAGAVLGTFAMYYREPRAPTETDIRLIEQAAAIAGIAIDRDRAEQALRRERDFNRTLVQESPTFFVAIGGDGRTILMNDTMLRAVGYTQHEVEGTDYLTTFVPEADRPALVKIFESLMAGTSRTVNENRVRSRDGRELLIEWHGNTVLDANGRPLYFFGVGIDITERRRLEERILQTQKMETVGRLAAGVAHDFNNLVSTLHSHIATARVHIPPNHAAADALNRSEQVAEQCSDLVRSLLTFTRQLPARRVPVDLNAIAQQAVRLLEPILGEGISVSLFLDDEAPPIIADAGQIQQVVMNLCVNSRDAMPHGGQLEIRTVRSELPASEASADGATRPAVELSIGDTGCGMDDATRERAFEPFFTTKEGGRGTGLGLSIVYGIVNEHGGRIHIATQPKLGTIVRVRLPAATDAKIARDGKAIAPRTRWAEPQALTVLFADDETELLEANARFLEAHGISVVRAETGADALRLFEAARDRFDVVMLDHKMPGLNGLECARRIAALSPDTPILMTTGYVTAEVASTEANEHKISVLQKPFRPHALLDRIRELAASRRPD